MYLKFYRAVENSESTPLGPFTEVYMDDSRLIVTQTVDNKPLIIQVATLVQDTSGDSSHPWLIDHEFHLTSMQGQNSYWDGWKLVDRLE